MKKGFSAGKVILFFFGLFVIGVIFVFVGIANKNNFFAELGNVMITAGILVGSLVMMITLIWEGLRGTEAVAAGRLMTIESLGLSAARSPNEVYFKEKVHTGVFESEEIISMIADLSADEHGWRAVPWCLLRRQYDRSIGSALTFNDRRVPDLSKDGMDVDFEGTFELEEGKLSLSQSNNSPEFLFNGMKHSYERGFVEIIQGERDDYIVLTDKGIGLFPVRQVTHESKNSFKIVSSWPRE